MNDAMMARVRLPVWMWLFAALGVAWNAFGIVQLVDFVTQQRASLMMKEMTPPAAELYYGLPLWMKLVFAIGSVGGLIGSLMLGARRAPRPRSLPCRSPATSRCSPATTPTACSTRSPAKMAVLLVVVAIAAALLVASLWAGRQGLFGR